MHTSFSVDARSLFERSCNVTLGLWVRLSAVDVNFKEVLVTQQKKVHPKQFKIVKLEPRIAPSQSHFPPGQFPAGNPAQAPGASNEPGNSGK